MKMYHLRKILIGLFDFEVKPFVPDAWIGSKLKNKVGYEIPFTKHFYKYKPTRTLEEIDADIVQLEKEIYEGIKGLRDK